LESKNIMKQIPFSAYEFKPGDIVTRLIPSKPIKIMGEETIVDRGYIGEELMFLGIVNGCVNVERMNHTKQDLLKAMFSPGPVMISLPLDAYDEGWAYYIDPYSLLDNVNEEAPQKKKKKPQGILIDEELSLEMLNKLFDEAVRTQNFEEAAALKIRIKELSKKK
jgi:hypothetical protein